MADVPESAKSVTASLWLEQAEQHNPILPTPGSPMAAAVAEEMEEYADRKLADFLSTRAAPPAMDHSEVISTLRQYINDLRYPPSADSAERRIAAAERVIAKVISASQECSQ